MNDFAHCVMKSITHTHVLHLQNALCKIFSSIEKITQMINAHASCTLPVRIKSLFTAVDFYSFLLTSGN